MCMNKWTSGRSKKHHTASRQVTAAEVEEEAQLSKDLLELEDAEPGRHSKAERAIGQAVFRKAPVQKPVNCTGTAAAGAAEALLLIKQGVKGGGSRGATDAPAAAKQPAVQQLGGCDRDSDEPQWTELQECVYVDRKRHVLKPDLVPVCTCDPAKGRCCDGNSSCLCRELQVECDPEHCPAGAKCRNQRMQQRLTPQLCIKRAGDGKGRGLFARQHIPAGSYVCTYLGEVVSSKEAVRRRMQYAQQGMQHYYMMSLSGSEVIDATVKGGIARFANHSCGPNCATEKWSVGGETLVGLFARQDIKEGEEITYNYKFTWFGEAATSCKCGAASCTGLLGQARGEGRAEGAVRAAPQAPPCSLQ